MLWLICGRLKWSRLEIDGVNRKQRLSSRSASLTVIWLGTFPRIEGNAKTKDHQSDRRGSHWSSWHAMNALPSHVRYYLAVRIPVSLLCVNRHRSVRLLCCLHRRGRKPQKKEEFVWGMNASCTDCQQCFTRAENRLIPVLTKVQECNVLLCHLRHL